MRYLGLDVGIASIGWSVVDIPSKLGGEGRIVGTGVWLFNPVEETNDKGQKLKSEERRILRGMRRTIRRRKQRMDAIRKLFAERKMIDGNSKDPLRIGGVCPWEARVAGLERCLSGEEFAVALAHIAKHRGFRSNAKGVTPNEIIESKEMLSQSAILKERAGKHASVATALMNEPDYVIRDFITKAGRSVQVRKLRNTKDNYKMTVMRSDLEYEVGRLFEMQREFGNPDAEEFVEETYRRWAFWPGEMKDKDDLVGYCTFEQGERRLPKAAPSFELFRFLCKLAVIRIGADGQKRGMSVDEIERARSEFGYTEKFTYSKLRKSIDLSDRETFVGVANADESRTDIVSNSGASARATALLYKLISGECGLAAWDQLQKTPEMLDEAMQVIVYKQNAARIQEGIQAIQLPAAVEICIRNAVLRGEFSSFSGVGHLSSKALGVIIPGLLKGVRYDEACRIAGYVHTDSRLSRIFQTGKVGAEAIRLLLSEQRISKAVVGSATARKAIIEALKQVSAIIGEYGDPDRIHIEVARDLAKTADERNAISSQRMKREKDRAKQTAEFVDHFGREPLGQEANKFEIWKSQSGSCIYTGAAIPLSAIIDGDNAAQIDHALPWSRFADDNKANRFLCTAKANQEKGSRTPHEWFVQDKGEQAWHDFVAKIEGMASLRGMQKRNLTMTVSGEQEKKFLNRNLSDTAWATRVLMVALLNIFPGDFNSDGSQVRRVFARPGRLTEVLRRGWGLQFIKKDEDGNRRHDDRHHALDAIIVATARETLLQQITENDEYLKALPYPWQGFRADILDAVETVFVARAENHRGRGAIHRETVRGYKATEAGATIYERKTVESLTLDDLERFENPERQRDLKESLTKWIIARDAAKAVKQQFSELPTSGAGDVLRKVKLVKSKCSRIDLKIRGGAADPYGIVRVDLFEGRSTKGKSEFRSIPIYRHQIYQGESVPNLTVGTTSDVDVSGGGWTFLTSLHPGSFVEIVDASNAHRSGYYVGYDRSKGKLKLKNPHTEVFQRIGILNVKSITRIHVDRLGRRFKCSKEKRTWHGQLST